MDQLEISSEVVSTVARTCHEINRSYCAALGDHSQVAWEEAPDNIRQSAIHGVMFHLMNPHTTPAESHATWMAFKAKEGWTYGTEKDADKKTHPCMVPYEQLPEAQRAKDYLFSATVRQTMRLVSEMSAKSSED